MKILVVSYRYHPDLGGIETTSRLLAEGLSARGHNVAVLTSPALAQPRSSRESIGGVVVHRGMRFWQSVRLHSEADVVFHNNISVRLAIPMLFARRPWVIAVCTWIARPDGKIALQDKFKRLLLRMAQVISISASVAESLPVASTVIPNSYRDDVFKDEGKARDRTAIVFAGRLVRDKGLLLLLEALRDLHHQGLDFSVRVVGDGPERSAAESYVRVHGFDHLVTFLGARSSKELNEIFNMSEIAVVPSIWREPFGVVALEAAAAGCVLLASRDGGLRDAVGPTGLTFSNGSAYELAAKLRTLLTDDRVVRHLRSHQPEHLAHHTMRQMVDAYEDVIADAAGISR